MTFDFGKIHPASIQSKIQNKEEFIDKINYKFNPFFLFIFIIICFIIYESKFIDINNISDNKIYIFLIIITIIIIEKYVYKI
jgi:hypothetical protein